MTKSTTSSSYFLTNFEGQRVFERKLSKKQLTEINKELFGPKFQHKLSRSPQNAYKVPEFINFPINSAQEHNLNLSTMFSSNEALGLEDGNRVFNLVQKVHRNIKLDVNRELYNMTEDKGTLYDLLE